MWHMIELCYHGCIKWNNAIILAPMQWQKTFIYKTYIVGNYTLIISAWSHTLIMPFRAASADGHNGNLKFGS